MMRPYEKAQKLLNGAWDDIHFFQKILHDNEIRDEVLYVHANRIVKKIIRSYMFALSLHWNSHSIMNGIDFIRQCGIQLPESSYHIKKLSRFGKITTSKKIQKKEIMGHQQLHDMLLDLYNWVLHQLELYPNKPVMVDI